MKRCLLHIGAPKTGSTALQKFLATNRDRLLERGLHYPAASLRAFGHHDIAFLVGGGYPAWATPQERPLQELVGELAAEVAGAALVVLSSENFYLLPNPDAVAEVLARVGVQARQTRVVVYLRRQDEAQVSWYNQVVKAQGYSGSIGQSIAETRALWDYEAQLARWSAVFGAERLAVRVYQRSELAGGDIRRDFLQLAEIPEAGLQFEQAEVNSRINAEVLEFQRLINRLPLPPQQKRSAHKELIALTEAAREGRLFADSPLLGARERASILSSYARGNEAVARSYLKRAQLFDTELPSGLPSVAPGTQLTPETLVYILGWLLARGSRP